MGKKLDITGQKFNRLTATEYAYTKRTPSGSALRFWRCICECGNIVEIPVGPLKNGNTKSCGCYATERRKEAKTTHGRSNDRVLRVYKSMIQRCTNPNDKAYHNYGGRGIAVCDRWLESFQNFIADMGERPIGMTLERLDNSLGYNPSNCAWRSTQDQNRNKRTNRMITINGETKCLVEWSEIVGIDRFVIKDRICKLKWSPEASVLTPYNPDPKARAIARASTKRFTIDGITKSLPEWALEYNQPASRVHQRVFVRGWEPLDALTTPPGVRNRWNKPTPPA